MSETKTITDRGEAINAIAKKRTLETTSSTQYTDILPQETQRAREQQEPTALVPL